MTDQTSVESASEIQRDMRNTLRIIAVFLLVIGVLLAAIVFGFTDVSVKPG